MHEECWGNEREWPAWAEIVIGSVLLFWDRDKNLNGSVNLFSLISLTSQTCLHLCLGSDVVQLCDLSKQESLWKQ